MKHTPQRRVVSVDPPRPFFTLLVNTMLIETSLAEVEKMMLVLLIQANLPKEHWHYAVRHAITIIKQATKPQAGLAHTSRDNVHGTQLWHHESESVWLRLSAVQVPSNMRRKLGYER